MPVNLSNDFGVDWQAGVACTETFDSTMTSWAISADFGLSMQLPALIGLIDQHRSLQRAEILSAEGYWKFSNGVVHRFLIIELQRHSQTPIWLRLDRRRDVRVNPAVFLLRAGQTPANDTVRDSILNRARKINAISFRLNLQQGKKI